MPKPLLSIGIIFRDDIRCIERCLEALRPLREAIPCELVMADTGSVDGSREIAEKYADILFDFPWINDFAAARNAVIDRCSGEWHLTVDTDEYLDGDFSDLVTVLKRRGGPLDLYLVNIRNYPDYGMEEPYTDFLAMRLFRRTAGIRYEGAIHERLTGAREGSVACPLPRVVFKHDGYADADKEAGRAKRERNMALLREELRRKPDDLLRWLQIIESGLDEEDYPELIRRATALVKEKADEWERYGPPIFRYAAIAAAVGKIPGFRGWLEQAETWFPDSYFTRIDVGYYAVIRAWQDKEYEECARRGELLRAAYADFRAGRGDVNCAAINPLKAGAPYFEALTGILLAASCQELGRGERAVPILLELDYGSLDEDQAENAVRTLCAIHSQSGADTAALVKIMWEGLCAPVPSERRGAARRAAFLRTASVTFQAGYRKSERERQDFRRHAYTAFLPLAGMCVMGDAAVIMGSADADAIERLLRTVERWDQLPAAALEHALSEGVVFPLPDKPLTLEEMDILAGRMAQEDSDALIRRTVQLAERLPEDWQGLIWVRELALAAVQSCDWDQAGQGMDLCRAFARIEGAVLPRYYGKALLCEENIHVLPPMHRFGWYCAQAFEAMDGGGHAEYARLLRAGLTSCPSMRAMAEFLMRELERTMRLQAPPELLSLAERVRTLLAAYDPDDPAVKALKASLAYQKVAHLIEGPDLGVWGGLPQ